MEPTAPNSGWRFHALLELLPAAAWTVLVTATLLLALERFAGTLPRQSIVAAIATACAAGGLGLVAAGLVLRGEQPAGASAGLCWRPERLPAIALSVLPPLAMGLLIVPAGAIAAQGALCVLAGASALFLMSNVWPWVLSRKPSGEDLAELVQESLPIRAANPRAIDATGPHVLGFPAVHRAPAAPGTPERPASFTLFRPPEENLPAEPDAESLDACEEADDVVLRMIRRTDEAGIDTLEGVFRFDLPAGQRQGTFHLAFIPAFAAAPAFECDVDGDATIRVKVGVVLPWGARVEARRSNAAEDLRIRVAFRAFLEEVERAPGFPPAADSAETPHRADAGPASAAR